MPVNNAVASGLAANLHMNAPASTQTLLVSSPTTRKHEKANFSMTIQQRRQLCMYAEQHPEANQKQLIEWFRQNFNVAPSQAAISRCLKRKNDILESTERDPSLKRLKKVTFPLMEDALSKWYQAYKGLIPIDGNTLRQQGSYFLNTFYPSAGEDAFQFSDGWLGRFKARHRIKRDAVPTSVKPIAKIRSLQEQIPALRSRIAQYAPKDVFNMHESGLFYQTVGNGLFARRLNAATISEQEQMPGAYPGIFNNKFTITVCSNSDGSEKVPCWVIGRNPCPSCFVGVVLTGMDVPYAHHPNAKMSAALFAKYLLWFDRLMSGRRVILIVDYSEAHLAFDGQLINTELLVLPPSTAVYGISPCQIGVSNILKSSYRRRFTEILVARIEQGDNRMFVSVLESMNIIKQAWKEDVHPDAIVECFLNSKLMSEASSDPDSATALTLFKHQLEMVSSAMLHSTNSGSLSSNPRQYFAGYMASDVLRPGPVASPSDKMNYEDIYRVLNGGGHNIFGVPSIEEIVEEIEQEADKLAGRNRTKSNGSQSSTSDFMSDDAEFLTQDNEQLVGDLLICETVPDLARFPGGFADQSDGLERKIVTDIEALVAISTLERYWMMRRPEIMSQSLPGQRHEILTKRIVLKQSTIEQIFG